MSVSWFHRQPTVSADEKIARWRCCRHDAILCVAQPIKKSDGRTLEDFLHFGTPVADLRNSERKDNLPEIKLVKFFGDLTIFTDYNKLRVRCSRTYFFPVGILYTCSYLRKAATRIKSTEDRGAGKQQRTRHSNSVSQFYS